MSGSQLASVVSICSCFTSEEDSFNASRSSLICASPDLDSDGRLTDDSSANELGCASAWEISVVMKELGLDEAAVDDLNFMGS